MDKLKALTPNVKAILRDKATEAPNTGVYNHHKGQGTYLCRQCGLALFRSDHKFISSCGWPSFDDGLPNTIKRLPDADGRRTEILCNRCEGHLGHVFHGEGYTAKNQRHCVNSLAIDFVADLKVIDSEEAIFAAGCFWGVQHELDKIAGVLKTEVGYCGGDAYDPSYEQVITGRTGHLEAVRVLYDPSRIDYLELCKVFFEIHDPTQIDGQGPDLGNQYLSAVFYYNDKQREQTQVVIDILQQQGLQVATQLRVAAIFWSAEDYHQDYYAKNGQTPYCHSRVKRF